MSEFEYILTCFLTPVVYVITYIAGKYDILSLICKMLEEKAKEYGEEVCVWFKYDYRTIAPKNHDAENPYWRIPEDMDKLKYCPYCGKKIKVVE